MRLLAKKSYDQITVQEIIDEANIGRTTFYAHFKVKEYLLKDMCESLFGHIIDTAIEFSALSGSATGNYSVFLHLLIRLQNRNCAVLELLSSQNNEIFLGYFKSNLKKLIISQYVDTGLLKNSDLPEDFLVNHIASSFVDTVDWWVSQKMAEPPEQITKYFLGTIEPLLNVQTDGDMPQTHFS